MDKIVVYMYKFIEYKLYMCNCVVKKWYKMVVDLPLNFFCNPLVGQLADKQPFPWKKLLLIVTVKIIFWYIC